MRHLIFIILSFVLTVPISSCKGQTYNSITPAAERTEVYLSLLEGKNVGVVANHTSLVDGVHLVDTLLSMGVDVKRIFSPEHGFRGDRDPGEYVKDYTDQKTKLPVISLYGKNKKPELSDLDGLDLIVFDLQDVGVRFYTYISTMHYVMEACAETRTSMIIFDRPNPNGFYMDGPVLDSQHTSFVGVHPIPLVHGMTIAELAQMINQEGWLKGGVRCDLNWVKCAHYTHDSLYQLPVKPSPNLPNMRSVYLYPSLGLFEGTMINVGRGTDFPFQVFGHPNLEGGNIHYQPRSIPGASTHPKHKGKLCHGYDLRNFPLDSIIDSPGIRLQWLTLTYQQFSSEESFFSPFFSYLAGTDELKKAIKEERSISDIKKSWQEDLDAFARIREQYLLYPDFTK